MRTSVIRIIKLITIVSFCGNVFAIDTSTEEKTCSEIGFKRKTEAFGNCVLELIDRKNKSQQVKAARTTTPSNNAIRQSTAQNQRPAQEKPPSPIVGDGSPDDNTCQTYGFKPGTANYSECRQKIDLARQDGQRQQAQYEAQQRQYEAQMAEYKRQREMAASMALMQMGLGMMAGGSPATNFAPPPVAPVAPRNNTQTYFLPNGRAMTCTTTGSHTNCF